MASGSERGSGTMIMSDKFSIHTGNNIVFLRCDICDARDMFSGDVFAWDADEDINLSALISRAQGHWAQIHDQEVVG